MPQSERDIEIRHLRAFVAVAQHGSVTRAAEDLHIAQPPLSRQIQQLEQMLGIQLFIRAGNGVSLTPAGARLLDRARVVLAEVSHLTAVARAEHDRNPVRVGTTQGLVDVLARIRRHLQAHEPHVEFAPVDLAANLQSEALLRREIDAGILRGLHIDAPRLRTRPLLRERFVVLMRTDNPLASQTSLRVRDIADEPLLLHHRHINVVGYDMIMGVYETAGFAPRVVPCEHLPVTQSGMMYVATGEAIAIGLRGEWSRLYIESRDVVAIPLDEPGAYYDVQLVWRADEDGAAVLRFLDVMATLFPVPAGPG